MSSLPTTRPSLAPFAALIFAAACASAGLSPRAALIADADRQAKEALAAESRIDVNKIPARSLAVLPFAVDAADTLLQPLGYAMADLLGTDLSRSSQLVVVERLRTAAIFRELDLVEKGIVDPRGAPRVGRLIGARRLLVGSVTMAADGEIVFNARLVDVLSGTVAPLVSARAPLARVIDAERALALRIIEELGVVLTPAERIAIEQRQAVNASAMVAYGKGLQAETKGDIPGALAAFEEASRLDAAFAATHGGATQAGASGAARGRSSSSSSMRAATGLQRLLELSAEAVNAPVATKLPEAVDVPFTSQLVMFLVTLRIF